MEINGLAHVILNVRNVSASRAFYSALLGHLGLSQVLDTPTNLYWVGGRTAIGIRAAEGEAAGAPFDQRRVGLHHLCFRARTREDVTSVFDLVTSLGGTIIRAPEEGPWVPGYFSTLFEDPDGIRIEVNHVPGKGVKEEGVRFDGSGTPEYS